MRTILLAIGIASLVAGGALLFISVVPDSGHGGTVTLNSSNHGWNQVVQNVSGISITGSIPVSVTWSSSAFIDVDAATCAGYCRNVSQVASSMRVQMGTRGSISLNQPNGGSIFIAYAQQSAPPASVNVTFSIWTGLTIGGPILLVGGSILVILGVLLSPKIPETPKRLTVPAP